MKALRLCLSVESVTCRPQRPGDQKRLYSKTGVTVSNTAWYMDACPYFSGLFDLSTTAPTTRSPTPLTSVQNSRC
jgi:hypothetical protein